MARKTKNKNAGNPGQDALNNTNPVLICGVDQNARSVDISCLMPSDVNTDVVINEFEQYFVSVIYREWSRASVYNALMIEDGNIIYMKIPIPSEEEDNPHNQVRVWVTLWATTKLIKLFRRLRNIHGIQGVVGIEDLRGLAKKRKINTLRYKRIFNLLTAHKTPLITRRIPALMDNQYEYEASIFRGHGGHYYVISIDPRNTSSICGLCIIESATYQPVKELSERKVKCPRHGIMDRDHNASLVIMRQTYVAYMVLKRFIANPARGGERPWAPSPGPTHPGLGKKNDEEGGADAPDVEDRKGKKRAPLCGARRIAERARRHSTPSSLKCPGLPRAPGWVERDKCLFKVSARKPTPTNPTWGS
ncbi:zinc ribbon domain-containing protein [Vulcanisaeta thermophila]|uniref:zinc ribbon domain-containing protein n=1 Tax=Vulcanisaeta thermophila TaxID=867917 RepID=UPI00117FCFBD|nr:zinc ribbon domain-containing protein [Vulcanisaeta thermophila]